MKQQDRGLEPLNRENTSDIDNLERTAEYVRRYLSLPESFTDKEIIEYVQTKFTPEEVFGTDRLVVWALMNGFVKPENK